MYDWKAFSGQTFDRPSFAARIGELKWLSWKPQGITLHNTGAPTLAQWVEFGPAHDQRIANLKTYYQGLGWHAGPAAFVSRSHVTEFSGFLDPGVHCSCWNHTHIGIEMAGDFSTESFDTGDGAMVREIAVFAFATLLHALGLPANAQTINFHRDCAQDHHACPGSNVVSADFISRIAATMPT